MIDVSQIRIRPAERRDIGDIVRLLADDPLGQEREHPAAPLSSGYLKTFDAISADRQHALVVVEAPDGEVVGCLQISFIPGLSYQGGTRALIEDVRVDARHRRQKIGHRLVEWAVAEARLRQCCLVQLFTHETRTDALRFYAGLGFRHHHAGMRLPLSD